MTKTRRALTPGPSPDDRARGATRLRFVGTAPADGSALALAEGWPAADHDESDPAVAAEKLASGSYEEVVSHGDSA